MTGPYPRTMTSVVKYLNIKSTHEGFDVRAGGDEKQIINLAWPKYLRKLYLEAKFCIFRKKKLKLSEHMATYSEPV